MCCRGEPRDQGVGVGLEVSLRFVSLDSYNGLEEPLLLEMGEFKMFGDGAA